MKLLKINIFTSPIACCNQAAPTQVRWSAGCVDAISHGSLIEIEERGDKGFENNVYNKSVLSTSGSLPMFYTFQIPTC